NLSPKLREVGTDACSKPTPRLSLETPPVSGSRRIVFESCTHSNARLEPIRDTVAPLMPGIRCTIRDGSLYDTYASRSFRKDPSNTYICAMPPLSYQVCASVAMVLA